MLFEARLTDSETTQSGISSTTSIRRRTMVSVPWSHRVGGGGYLNETSTQRLRLSSRLLRLIETWLRRRQRPK